MDDLSCSGNDANVRSLREDGRSAYAPKAVVRGSREEIERKRHASKRAPVEMQKTNRTDLE
jgi:hypothetical protein